MRIKGRAVAVLEFIAVVFSCFVVASGVAFLEAISAFSEVFTVYREFPSQRAGLVGVAAFGGAIGGVTGVLVYYLFLRPGLSVREACLIVLAALLAGVPSAFLGPLSMVIIPTATFFSAGYLAALRTREGHSSNLLRDKAAAALAPLNHRIRAFFRLTGELISVMVCGLVIGLGFGVLSITEAPIRDDAMQRMLRWGLTGLGFVPALYYLMLRDFLAMALVAVLIPFCGVVTIVSASILPETRQTGSLLLTGAAALQVSFCARIRRRRSA